jgi:hypothetical protein
VMSNEVLGWLLFAACVAFLLALRSVFKEL